MQALGAARRGALLRLTFPADEFPPRDYVFLVGCPELSVPAHAKHRATPITLVRDVLAHLPLVRDLERANGNQRVGLVLPAAAGAPELWLDEAAPLYAFDLGERLETLELRTRPRLPPPMPLRLLAESADLAAALVAPWVTVDGAASAAELLPQVVARLRLAPAPALRLVRHTDDGWQWLVPHAALRTQVAPGDVLSARTPPLLELTPLLEPPPAPLLLPLDTSVADACRRLAGFVPGAAAEHPLWRPWSDDAGAAPYHLALHPHDALAPPLLLDPARPLAHYHAALAAPRVALSLRPSRPPPVLPAAAPPAAALPAPFEALALRISFAAAPPAAPPASASLPTRPLLSAAPPPAPAPPPAASPPSAPSVAIASVLPTLTRARASSHAAVPPPVVQSPPPVVPRERERAEAEAEADAFDLLAGEAVVARVERVAVQEGWAAGVELEDEARLTLTTFRAALHFVGGARRELHLPHHAVARIEKVGSHAAEIESKHCFVFRVRFRAPDQRRAWLAAWDDAVQGAPFAVRAEAHLAKRADDDNVTALEAELARLFARAPGKWRVTDANRDFGLCATYGRVLAVPAALSDDALRAVAAFRSKGRIPVLSYVHTNGAPLLRSAQPKPGISRWRCAEDERLLQESAASAGGRGQMALYDARLRMHAMANQALGAGVETTAHYPFLMSVAFLGVPNIHTMRESYARLQAALGVHAYDWAAEGDAWLPALERSEWLAHVKLLLQGALRIATSLHREAHAVLVHCSDGWDRTSQLVSLALLMLDPAYRTISGYALLIEKEWLAPGHKFHARCGHRNPPAAPAAPVAPAAGAGAAGTSGAASKSAEEGRAASKSVEEGRAPIFLQFLDCTSQLMAQFPCAFEFGPAYLLAIADALHSCEFGTFLFNSDRERHERHARRAPQLWPHLAARAAEFASPFFVPAETILPDVRAVSLRFWSAYFLRERRTQREGDDTQPEERGRQLKSTCEGLYRQVQDAEKELRRVRRQSAGGPVAAKRP